MRSDRSESWLIGCNTLVYNCLSLVWDLCLPANVAKKYDANESKICFPSSLFSHYAGESEKTVPKPLSE